MQSCLHTLETGSFVALVGPSGSGKSSIMRAGVLAALRDRGHTIVVITPGRRPVEALTALPDNADARTVLAIDQTEEVFALCEDPAVDWLPGRAARGSRGVPGLDRAVEFACQMAGRSLTEDEWAEFLPTQPYRDVCPGL